MSLGTMKQYKLTAWPDLPPRFQKTTMRRVVSELSQRFVSVRDLARSCGAASRDIVEQVARDIRAGDVVLVKGSLGSKMAVFIDAFKARAV